MQLLVTGMAAAVRSSSTSFSPPLSAAGVVGVLASTTSSWEWFFKLRRSDTCIGADMVVLSQFQPVGYTPCKPC